MGSTSNCSTLNSYPLIYSCKWKEIDSKRRKNYHLSYGLCFVDPFIWLNIRDLKPLSVLGSKGLGKMLRNHGRLYDYSIIIP